MIYFIFFILFSFFSYNLYNLAKVIGGWGGQRVIIRRKQGANVLREVQLVDILANDKWIAFLIQITTRTVAINCFSPSLHSVSLRSFSPSIYHSVCCVHFSLPFSIPIPIPIFSISLRMSRPAPVIIFPLIFIPTVALNSYMKRLMHLFVPFDFGV